MAFLVHVRSGSDGAVSVIVETALEVLAKIKELAEDGYAEIAVKDLEGAAVDLQTIEALTLR